MSTALQASRNPVAAELQRKMTAMKSVLPAHITPERMSRIALGMLRTNAKLAQVAMNNPESFVHAVLLASQLGLEPGVQGMAYLVPYGNEVQMIPGYKGLINLARRSGEISSIEAHIAYRNDEFDLSLGLEQKLTHKPRLDGDRGDPMLVYCIARFKDGGHHLECMTISEVNRIRDTKSKASKTGPWRDDYEEMARKTVVRRASKYWPMSIELQNAIAADDAGEAGQHVAFDDGVIDITGEPVDDGLPTMPADKFAVESKTWAKAIAAGKKTPVEIIATVSSKYTLTEEQRLAIEAMPVQANDGGAPEAMTYAQVAEALNAAGDVDTLDAKADLINRVENEAHRDELTGIYRSLRAGMEG